MEKKFWIRAALFLALAVLAGWWFFPSLEAVWRAGAGLMSALLSLFAFLLIVFVLPAVAIWLSGFAYSRLLRPYVRAWRINRIRNARYLREAVERGKEHSA
jgi:hypothetical protein